MDVKTFSNQLRNRMDEQIEVVQKEESDELRATAKIIQVIRDHLFELKQFIHQYEFKDPVEEILFFKEIKPEFLSKYIYHDKVLSIIIDESFANLKNRKKYYRKALKQIQKFQKNNFDFYLNWIAGRDHLDNNCFILNKDQPNDPNLDNKFSSVYDITLTQLMANEELKNYLNSKIKNGSFHSPEPKLQWTASKTALIELIYALQTVGVFHNKTVELKHIVSSFEQFFSIELGNYSRTFQEIRIRKGGQTRFLDILKEKMTQRLNDW